MAETKERVYVYKLEGAESVKEFKEQIADLRDKMVSAEKGTDEYKKAVDDLIGKETELKKAMYSRRQEASVGEKSYNALQQEMTALKKVWREVTDEATRNELGVKINDLNNQLKEMDASTGNFQRNVGNYKSALEALNKTYDSQRQELSALKKAMDNLDPSTKEYEQAFQRAAEITHNLQERQENLKFASKDLGDQLSNVRGIASNMIAGFSAAQAAMGLFGKESEDVQKAMLKMQQMIALVQGLEGLDGFMKRTQGLSIALGVSKKATIEQTAATQAETVATAADTTAKGAQTVATEGATVAQRGLNAAMKANPIGAVLLVVEAAIIAFSLFKDKIIELIGGAEKLNTVFNKVKVILGGVGNVIIKSVFTPVRLLINEFRTLASVVQALKERRFRDVAKIAEEGAVKTKNIIKESVQVIKNYKEGAAKAEQKIEAENTKKKKEQYDKDKENYIKDQEYKLGADWKYTEEGKKAYEELYKNRMEMYADNTDEYKQAQRDMWAYNREYEARKTADSKKGSENRKKYAIKAAQETATEMEKILKEYKSKVLDYMKDDKQKAYETVQERVKAWNDAMEKQGLGHLKISIEGFEFEQFTPEDFSKKLQEDIARPFADELLDAITEAENAIKRFVDSAQAEFDEKKLKLGIVIPDDEINLLQKQMNAEVNDIQKLINSANTKLAELAKSGLGDTEVYDKIEDKKTELTSKQTQARINYIQKISDVMKDSYNRDLDSAKAYYEEALKGNEMFYEQMYAENAANPLWSKNKGTEAQNLQKQLEQEYSILRTGYEKEMEIYDKMSKDTKLTYEERQNAKAMLSQKMMEYDDLETQHLIENAKLKKEITEQEIQNWMDLANGIGDIMGSVADLYKQNIEERVKNHTISDKQGEKEFESVKKLQIAQATIQTISGAIAAFMGCQSLGQPWGAILGAVQAAAVTAAGVAQIAQIKKTKLGSNSSPSGGVSYAIATPQQTDYNPDMVTNATGEQETENLANAITKNPIRAYCVESDVTAKQEMARSRQTESSF